MKWRLAAGWVLAVVATTAVAWQIVAVADERVGNAPLTPIEAAAPSTLGDAVTTTIEPTGAADSIDSTTSTPATTAISQAGTTTSSEAQGGGTTSTTSPTSTTSAAIWSTKTAASTGGTVVVSYRPGEVRLETAVPLPGFQVEIGKAGPPEVDVEFESSGLRVRVRAEWEDGSLEIDIDESPEGEESD